MEHGAAVEEQLMAEQGGRAVKAGRVEKRIKELLDANPEELRCCEALAATHRAEIREPMKAEYFANKARLCRCVLRAQRAARCFARQG